MKKVRVGDYEYGLTVTDAETGEVLDVSLDYVMAALYAEFALPYRLPMPASLSRTRERDEQEG